MRRAKDPRYQDSKYPDQRDPQSMQDQRGLDDSYHGSQQLNDTKRDPRYSPGDPRYPLTDKDPRYGVQGSQNLNPSQVPGERGSQSLEPKYTTQYVGSRPPTGTPSRPEDVYKQQQQQRPPSSPSDQSYDRSNPYPRSPQDSLSQQRSPSDSYRDPYKPRGLQKEDSLRRLQEWQKEQIHRPPSISSSQRSPADKPLSDGPRVYQDDRRPDDRSHRDSPRDPRYVQGQGQRSERPHDPAYQVSKVTTTTVTTSQDPRHQERVYENLRDHTTDPTVPLHVNVYDSAEMRQPAPHKGAPQPSEENPPIPAAYRQQYVEQLADTRTPHTRQDMLVSSEITMERSSEPLYFRYPEQQQQQKQRELQQQQQQQHQQKLQQQQLQQAQQVPYTKLSL